MTTHNNMTIALRYSGSTPCPVCETGSKGCSLAEDNAQLCRGEPTDPGAWTLLKRSSNGFGIFRRPLEDASRRPVKRRKPVAKQKPPSNDWPKLCTEFAANLTATLLLTLYRLLGLPASQKPDPLLGYMPAQRYWTRGERDGRGNIVGVQLRLRDGKKFMIPGSNRGLVYADDWRVQAVLRGLVLATEGGSDQLAASAVGVPAVGRPSAVDGVDHLVTLFADLPAEVSIWVIGDNDANGKGEQGARTTAEQLAQRLNRPIYWALTPHGFKDIREYVAHHYAGGKGTPVGQIGVDLVRVLTADDNRQVVTPPGTVRGNTAELPQVILDTAEHHVNAQVAEALGREPDLYQRGGALVQVSFREVDDDPSSPVRRVAGAPVIQQVSAWQLRERMTRCVAFVTHRGTGASARLVPAHPPPWCVNAVHDRGEWPDVRHLHAVIPYPVLLPDGRLIVGGGYNSDTGVLVHQPPGVVVDVPEKPTREQVRMAVTKLLAVVVDFPFQTEAHKAVWLAGLLTPLARFLYRGPAPMFLIDKNVRGAGAGLLADVISLILTGRRFAVVSYPKDKEELRKKITTLAVEGEIMALFDNLAGPVGNEVLDAALTCERWKDRLLGGNKQYDGPLNVIWFGTGNNVQLLADTSRRVAHIRLESLDEHPERKSGFRHPDLRGHVMAHRGELLSAALTIFRGWLAAGRPQYALSPWGSFEGWSGVVREAVVFAGLPDPGETRQALQAGADREAANVHDLIAGLAYMDPCGRGMTCSAIIDRLRILPDSEPELLKAMREAIEELCGKLCSRLLGYKLRHFKRRNFAGLMLDEGNKDNGSNRWVVRQA